MTTLFALVVLMNGHVSSIGHFATKSACELQGEVLADISQQTDFVCMRVQVPPVVEDQE